MALMSLGFASFAFAVVKIVANTALLGKPDVNALLYSGIDIGIWNSIENDFVLSAACLPSVPPFFRACKDFVQTHTSTFSRKSYSTSFAPPKASNEPKGPDDSGAMELARYDELPEAPPSKNIKGLTGLG
ncbi:MAG: hypothetical protein LQ339_007315 [Xanthoria mediterranea]|nr:MAG: hypothetical protein LQ339_007315 [Xanthoria mediterranea]